MEITVRSRNAPVASGNPDCIVVEVSDSGIGFDAEVAERIFEPFIQANQLITQRFGGLGLGLAISKATVDAHGGTIRAGEAQVRAKALLSLSPYRFPNHELIIAQMGWTSLCQAARTGALPKSALAKPAFTR